MSQFDTENKDVLLAMAIASGASSAETARDLDVSISTVKRRMADPEFKQLVNDLRREMLTTALGRMSHNMTRAADTVAALLDAEEPYIRLRAARAMLTLGMKLNDAVDLTERIHELEMKVAQANEPQW
jgi:transposase-like protein